LPLARQCLKLKTFFAVVERSFCFLSASAVHPLRIAEQKEIQCEERNREYQQLSDKRWSCRATACNTLLNKIGVVK